MISNTDYVYRGESTRKAHYDYRLQLMKGAVRAANIYVKWYDWVKDLKDIISGTDTYAATTDDVLLFPNPVESHNGILNIKFLNQDKEERTIEINDARGQLIYRNSVRTDLTLGIAGLLQPGLYFITIKTFTNRKTYKLVVI